MLLYSYNILENKFKKETLNIKLIYYYILYIYTILIITLVYLALLILFFYLLSKFVDVFKNILIL